VKPINPTVKKYRYARGGYYWLVAFTKPNGERYRKKHATELAAQTDRACQIGLFSTSVTPEEMETSRAAILTLKNSANPDVRGKSILEAAEFFGMRYEDPLRTLPLAEYGAEFIERKRKENLRPPTIAEIEKFITEFIDDFPNLNVRHFTPAMADKYLNVAHRPNRNRKAVLNQFFNYLAGTALTTNRHERVIALNPLRAIPHRRKEDRDITEIKILNVDETIRLLKRAASFNAQRLFVWLLFTGMRPTETLKFWKKGPDGKDGWQFINLNAGLITVNASISKTRKSRLIKIQPNLRQWLEHYRGENFLTNNWRDKYLFSKDVLSVEKRNTSDLCRHTFISYLAHVVTGWHELELQAGNTKHIQLQHYLALVNDSPKAFWEIVPTTIGAFDVSEQEFARKGYMNRRAAILRNRCLITRKRNGMPLNAAVA
jgi:hypothetical protein